MCEAQVNQVKDCPFTLSKHMNVEVSGTGQVVFVCIPDRDFMTPTRVSLTGKAWNAFVKEARATVNKLLQEKKENIWEYHPNSKYVRVSRNDYGSSLVSLLTINRRGAEMRQYSIYLNEQEWYALDKCADKITELLQKMHRQHVVQANCEILTYKWKFAPTVEVEYPPVCEDNYYTEDHAKERGMEVTVTETIPLGQMEIITELLPAPDPMKFYLMVYLTLLYKCCEKLNVINCQACANDEVGKHPSHREYTGCMAYGRSVVRDYLPSARKLLKKKHVGEIFLKCWKFLKLGNVNVDKIWNNIMILIPEDDKTDYVQSKVTNLRSNYRNIPECMLVNDYIRDYQLMEWLNKNNRDCLYDASDSSSENSPKKLKLDVDSDDDPSPCCSEVLI